MKLKMISSAMLLAGCGITAGAAMAVEIPKDFLSQVREAMPPEAGDPKVLADLMRPEVGPQLSRNFSLRNASRGLRDKLTPSSDCYLATKPDGDPDIPLDECEYRRGEPNGEGAASMMKVDLAEGKLKYLNRGREPDINQVEVKITPEKALQNALQLASLVGIPEAEIARQFMTSSERMVAGTSNDGKGELVKRRLGVQVLLPRCMPVRGEAVADCVPVFNSGLRAVMTDAGPNWMKGTWTDFKMAEVDQIVAPDMLVNDAATVLAEQMQPGTLAGLQMFIAYVQQREFAARDGSEQCPAPQDDEEKTGIPAVNTGLRYVPSLVIYAEPEAPAEGKATTQQTYSTGGLQYAIPMLKHRECGDTGEPRA